MLDLLYSQRYLSDRTSRILKPKHGPLYFALNEWKANSPPKFRRLLRLDSITFDALVATLQNHPIFANKSHNKHIDVAEQVAIALYRLGHYGNGSGLVETGFWSGFGTGRVDLITRRVFTAITSGSFRAMTLHMPTEEKKKHSRAWVEERSCAAWRGGWCGVDGSAVGIYARPAQYGSNWYDRRSNYSTNVQTVSLIGNLRIFDISIGLPRSSHDSTAWKQIASYQDHRLFKEESEDIWGDTAYPLEDWVFAPYKSHAPPLFTYPLLIQQSPACNIPENSIFNRYLSSVRVRSEHAIGYLKAHFSSLKLLPIAIPDLEHVTYLNSWILAAVCVHNFALMREDGGGYEADPLVMKYLAGLEEGHQHQGDAVFLAAVRDPGESRPAALAWGKLKREQLKTQLHNALAM